MVVTANQTIIPTLDVIDGVPRHQHAVWEACIEDAREATSYIDRGRWKVGDIAVAIVNQYGGRSVRGQDVLEQFAHEINMPTSSVREYCTVAKFWEPPQRAEVLRLPNITYTHCREAMRLGDIAHAKKFLKAVADKRMNITQARDELATRLGRKPTHVRVGTVNATVIEQTGTLVLMQIENDYNTPIPRLEVGESYQMSIYQALEGR